MAATSTLTASSLTQDLNFNWVFLVELLVCGVVTLFFIFYFNRLFATLLSYSLRAWTWHKYRVYIDIQSLQISILGGRIFFKGVKYHGNNETVLIHEGHLTWNYWLYRVRKLDFGRKGDQRAPITNSKVATEDGSTIGAKEDVSKLECGRDKPKQQLPCRLHIQIRGLEWFIYNRTPAYDGIIAAIVGEDETEAEVVHTEKDGEDEGRLDGLKRRFRTRLNKTAEEPDDIENVNSASAASDKSSARSSGDKQTIRNILTLDSSSTYPNSKPANTSALEDNAFLQFLPVQIDCAKAAVVLGNENTKSVLIVKVDKGSGEIDASASKEPDQYRQIINFDLDHPVIQMKPNDDYKEDQTTAGMRLKHGAKEPQFGTAQVHQKPFLHRIRRRAIHKLQRLIPAFRSSVESFSSELGANQTYSQSGEPTHWQGLSRYLDDDEQDDKARWSPIEYATVSTIVDSPGAKVSYYWDVPGLVASNTPISPNNAKPDINGDSSPGFGMDIWIRGATINYGPWADRQRADLQKVFFPSLCKDSITAKKLLPGRSRVATKFSLYVELEEETILRVPIREESKNWKWKKQADTWGQTLDDKKHRGKRKGKKNNEKGQPGPDVRPFGWLDVKVAANSTVRYSMDMVAGTSGFSNSVVIDIPSTEITTSVNHGLLWRSKDQRLDCDLSNPLGWNDLRQWKFDIASSDLELFILREHVFLLTDLIDDWASGPPPDYLTYTPFKYLVDLHFKNFRLYLNTNDSNIINNPSDFDDNTFLIIFGTQLDSKLSIPIDRYRPYRNDITFDVKAHTGGLDLQVPPWNTQATFLENTRLAQLKNLTIAGRYQYCSTTLPSNTDTLLMDVHARSLKLEIYGFVIKYFLTLKDNYFGDNIRFMTLDEYQQLLQSKVDQLDIDPAATQPYKKSNDLDVILTVGCDDNCLLLPSNLYSAKKHTRVETASLSLDLRFTNYYMDMQLKLEPLAFSLGHERDGAVTPGAASSSQLFIDGVDIYGHRVFGLPHTEPTYVCNWDFGVGAITGECSTDFVSSLAGSVRQLMFSLDDEENALPAATLVQIHDVTFLRASVQPIRVWLHVDDTAFLLSTGLISVEFDDWAGTYFSKKMHLDLPDLALACVDGESASRHRTRTQQGVETHAFLETTIEVNMVDRNVGFVEDQALQQLHIRREDSRTHRADFLLHPEVLRKLPEPATEAIDIPAMCFPPLPVPIDLGDIISWDTRSSASAKSSLQSSFRFPMTLQHKSSFLSTVGSSRSSQRSILRARSDPSRSQPRSRQTPDSRSRSRVPRPSVSHGLSRDRSTSTGHQSSFYSAFGDHGERRGTAPSSVTFSSSYMPPYFPLEAVHPDLKNVPDLNLDNWSEETELDEENEKINDSQFDDRSSYSSFVVELKNGIRAYCNPTAVDAVGQLLTTLQPVNPVDILDSLQVESIEDIFDQNKKKIMSGKNTDLKFIVPLTHLRFVTADSDTSSDVRSEVDQYDFIVRGLSATIRTGFAARTMGDDGERKSKMVLYLKTRSAEFSAKEQRYETDNPHAAVNAAIEDLIFWAVSEDKFAANLNVRSIEMATRSHKVEYLASLIHRTNHLASHFDNMFSAITAAQSSRLQLFTYLVTSAGSECSDPLFLTRPSYVLRSATDHLRMTDSWKVVTRLRHMFKSLDESAKDDIFMRCFRNNEICPADVKQQVLAGFDQWRSWDLDNLANCVVAQKIFGTLNHDFSSSGSEEAPIELALSVESTRLILDPGPKQNEIAFLNLMVKIETTPPLQPDENASDSNIVPVHATAVQISCKDTSINLNWELCDLAENVMRLYQQSPTPSPTPTVLSTQTLPRAQLNSNNLSRQVHVVLVTERGSVKLDTVNVQFTSISKGLKASVIFTDDLSGALVASAMLSAEDATTKTSNRLQELTHSRIRHPSLYISFESEKSETIKNNTWKVAANSQELDYVVKQDTLVLMEVVDLLIGDEVAQLYRLSQQVPDDLKTSPQAGLVEKHSAITKINVGLFLDMYHISIPLLQSLTYSISGVIARASVAAKLDGELIFDFDVKEHAHDIQTLVNDKKRSISLLQMPPTNGRVTSHTVPDEHVISVLASVEPIQLDAAAVHSLLTALNKPEILNVIKDLKDSAQLIQGHIEEIFPSKEASAKTDTAPSKLLIYEAHMSLAGFDVYVNTSGTETEHARLSFSIGCVQLEAANRLESSGPQLTFPEVRIALRDIMFELSHLKADGTEPCGNFALAAYFTASSKLSTAGDEVRSYHVQSDALEVNLFADTASTVVDVLGHLQNRMKDLDFSREKQYLQRLRKPNPRITVNDGSSENDGDGLSTNLFASMYSLELLEIKISWIVTSHARNSAKESEDLVLSFKRINLATRKENGAKLTIEDLQLQMVPTSQSKSIRSQNSALLPEVIFNVAYVSTHDGRRLAFQAAGKSLDLRLSSQFIIPAVDIKRSIESAMEKVRTAAATWVSTPPAETSREPSMVGKRKPFFGTKRLESLLIDADFAGAVVHLQNKRTDIGRSGRPRGLPGGRYGQFGQEEASSNTTLRAPGLAWKVEFKDNGLKDASLQGEIKVDASSNILYPTVVPLILEISQSVKEIVGSENDEQPKSPELKASPPKFMGVEEDNILSADPSTVLGRTRLNLGLRICKQDFSLSCQPIARVAATAMFDDIYVTVNTVKTNEHGHFFAISAAVNRLQASVQHVYSRESTGSFEVDSVVLSMMNSKHVSGTSGLSAILNVSPTKVLINAKQLQDFLLFREIWVPPELRSSEMSPENQATIHSQTILVQRYQQVAATGAFPWNATIFIAKLDVQLDLGQAIGKSDLNISKFWVSSKKNSDWEQNLCLGFEKIGIDSTGRMSGFIALEKFGVRTSIQWPHREKAMNQTPLIQASLGFSQLRLKAAFDYQPFLVADVTSSNFLMYNIRNTSLTGGDRLVAILDGDSVQAFCTTTTASQVLALYQAFQRLVQEKRSNYETSLKEIERFMKRKSVAPASVAPASVPLHGNILQSHKDGREKNKSPVSLHTDVVVTLKAVNVGVFPSTFHDQQVFKLEALNAEARFAVAMEDGKVHSALGLTLGQLRIGLAGVKRASITKIPGDISVEEVVESATGSRGGTILKVPKVEATMETWQDPDSNLIDYIFKSAFEGKVEVGWNYSRISYIRGMYGSHTRALAQRLGKPLGPSAVKLTGVPHPDEEPKDAEERKITAEVQVPQSKYNYYALEPPIIETPQLRDMGEATPPLEWIGLNRDKLPNLTHQFVIVALLEVASEVEDAYSKILGSS